LDLLGQALHLGQVGVEHLDLGALLSESGPLWTRHAGVV